MEHYRINHNGLYECLDCPMGRHTVWNTEAFCAEHGVRVHNWPTK